MRISRNTSLQSIFIGTALLCVMLGCTHPGSPSPAAGKRNPAPTTRRQHQLETFTGRLTLGLVLCPPPGLDESRYWTEITLDSPAKDAWQKIGMEILRDSELLVGPEALRDGDRITFEGYADKLFRSDRRHRMSELKNIRIIERASRPLPAADEYFVEYFSKEEAGLGALEEFKWGESHAPDLLNFLHRRLTLSPSPDSYLTLYTIQGQHRNWVRPQDIEPLIVQLDNEAPCAGIHRTRDSKLGNSQSTIRAEALRLIIGFMERRYPPLEDRILLNALLTDEGALNAYIKQVTVVASAMKQSGTKPSNTRPPH